jgi:AcrR family transcriptional regulator
MTPQTRENLLLSAARLFHEQGYAATGVATILREAGVNSGSLYHFFANKEALLSGVLQWYQDNLWPVVLGPVEQAEPDPVERIFRLLDWYREGMVASECRLGCPIGNLALEVSDTHPEVRPQIDANLKGWAAGIESWLQEAADRLPEGCDIRALSRFVLTVMEGGLMQARAAKELTAFDDSVQVLRHYFTHLLAGHQEPVQATPTEQQK